MYRYMSRSRLGDPGGLPASRVVVIGDTPIDSGTMEIPRDGSCPQGLEGHPEKAPGPQSQCDDPMALESIEAGSQLGAPCESLGELVFGSRVCGMGFAYFVLGPIQAFLRFETPGFAGRGGGLQGFLLTAQFLPGFLEQSLDSPQVEASGLQSSSLRPSSPGFLEQALDSPQVEAGGLQGFLLTAAVPPGIPGAIARIPASGLESQC